MHAGECFIGDRTDQFKVLSEALQKQLQAALQAKNDACSKLRAAERRADGACKQAEALRAEIGKAEGARKASAALAEVVSDWIGFDSIGLD